MSRSSEGEKGFTLIELLVVLGSLSMLLILANTVSANAMDIYERKVYIEQLKKDIYYAQTYAIEKQTRVNLKINTAKNEYNVSSFTSGSILKSGIEVHSIKFKPVGNITITFNTNGNILSPTTIYFADQNNNLIYKLVFQLGRGRFYITEV